MKTRFAILLILAAFSTSLEASAQPAQKPKPYRSPYPTQQMEQRGEKVCAVFSSYRCFTAEALAIWNASDVTAQISGKTVRTVSPVHGTQIEYVAGDGSAYLWYPGNSTVVASQWRIATGPRRFSARDLCQTFPADSFNPATQRNGGSEECQFLETWLIGVQETVSGDPFGLGKGAVPWVLAKDEPGTLAALIARREHGDKEEVEKAN